MNKPRLSFWQIWNMSFGFFGIQFGWGLQMANMSAIYQFLGADESAIPILWLAAPLTGLIVQPIIGYYSDRTWTRLGRRRPYFLVGAILASLALIAMPNSSSLWMAAGLLWILDASVNVSMEPFRAFVGDLLPGEQRKTGFAMQSLLIGGGAVLASVLPFVLVEGFGVSGEASAKSAIPPAVHIAFYAGSVIFFVAVLYTVVMTREHPPKDMEAFRKMKKESAGVGNAFREILQGILSMPKTMKQLAVVQFFTWFALFCMWIYFVPAVGKQIYGGEPLGVSDKPTKEFLQTDAANPVLAAAVALADGYDALKSRMEDQARADDAATGGGGLMDGILRMFGLAPSKPSTAERITASQLEELVRKHATTSASAGEIPGDRRSNPMVQTIAALLHEHGRDAAGVAEALATRLDLGRTYQKGAAWGGVCFAAYNLTAFAFSFLLLGLVSKFSAKGIHLVCLSIGAVGLLAAVLARDPQILIVSMIGVGVAWASILSMPYAMLSNAIPGEKMGFYMGVFNFFIVLPQILASVALGFVVERFLGNNALTAVLAGAVSMGIAAVSTLIVSSESTEHAVG